MTPTTQHPLLASPEILANLGDAAAARLAQAGATHLAELIAGGPRLAEAAGDRDTLRDWSAAARLMTLEGMTAPIAAALVAGGFTSAKELADGSLRIIERTVEKAKLKKQPTVYDLAALQQRAWKASGKGMVALQIQSLENQPLPEVTIRLDGQATQADENGWAAFGGVPAGKHRIQILLQDTYVPFGFGVNVREGELSGPIRVRLPARRRSPLATTLKRQSEGALVSNRGATAIRVETVALSELPDDAYLIVRPPLNDGRIPLVSLDKIRAGLEIRIQRVVVPAAEVPAGSTEGGLVHFINGRLVQTDLTPRDVTRVWLQQVNRRRREFTQPAQAQTGN